MIPNENKVAETPASMFLNENKVAGTSASMFLNENKVAETPASMFLNENKVAETFYNIKTKVPATIKSPPISVFIFTVITPKISTQLPHFPALNHFKKTTSPHPVYLSFLFYLIVETPLLKRV